MDLIVAVTVVCVIALVALCMPSASAAQNDEAIRYPGMDEAEVWILAGQSNMQGCGILRPEWDTDDRIMMFNMDNRWMVAQPPVHRLHESVAPVHKNIAMQSGMDDAAWEALRKQSREEALGGVGPGFFFAKRLVDTLNKPVALIPSAHGGTSMSQWAPDRKDEGSASLYGAMLERVRMTDADVKGMLWYQGESDGMDPTTSAKFEVTFLNFIDSVRRDLDKPDLPILYVQIGQFCTPANMADAYHHIREAQRRVAQLRDNVYVVSALDLPLDDLIHISTEGQERLGRRLAEVALSSVYQRAGHASPLALESIELTDGDAMRPRIRVTLSGVNGRLEALGRPTGFQLHGEFGEGTPPVVYKVDLDEKDPGTIVLWVFKDQGRPFPEALQLSYGYGMAPYVNIVDSEDMPVPAFGPLPIPWRAAE